MDARAVEAEEMEGCLISEEGPGMPAHFFDFLRHITEADGD